MAILRAFYPSASSQENGYFEVEMTGGVISSHIFVSDSDSVKEAKAPGIVAWLASPSNSILQYQIPLSEAKKNFKNFLDESVALTRDHITNKDSFYDSEESSYFLELWPEFFELQRWQDLPAPRPPRPATPKIDRYATLLRDEVNDPGFTLGNARNNLRRQLNNRRFNIMAEKLNPVSGDLEEYALRQPIYISMQKEAKQYLYREINRNAALTDDEKANQIQALADTMTKPNGEPKRLKLDDDPLNPKVIL